MYDRTNTNLHFNLDIIYIRTNNNRNRQGHNKILHFVKEFSSGMRVFDKKFPKKIKMLHRFVDY